MDAFRPLGAAIIAGLLAGCAVTPPPDPLPPPPAVIIVSPPRQAPPLPRPVLRVAAQFERVARKEMRAVTGPHVTVEFVHQVHAADMDARRALDALAREKLRPSHSALANAQSAVARLVEVLAAVPEDGP